MGTVPARRSRRARSALRSCPSVCVGAWRACLRGQGRAAGAQRRGRTRGAARADGYRHFAARDQLAAVVLERVLAGVSTRRYARAGEPVGSEVDELARSTSRSAVSREFVSRTREHLIELMSRPLDDLRLAVLMLDGIQLKDRCCVVALGIDTDGVKHPLGLWRLSELLCVSRGDWLVVVSRGSGLRSES